MSKTPKRHEMPELLSFIADCTAQTLRDCVHIEAETADHIGHEVAMQVAEKMAKQLVYIPSAENFLKHGRDEEIWSEFTGTNHNELARKYNISVQWVYRIIKKMNMIKSREICRSLFEDEET